MPEASAGEKTLPASPQKRQKAREEGNVAKSQDLNSAFALLVALGTLRVFGPYMLAYLVDAGRHFFGDAHLLLPEEDLLRFLAFDALWRVAQCVVPFMLFMMFAGLLANFLQVGVLLTSKPLVPKLERLNPISGFQKFVSPRALAELVKSLLKLALVGYIVYLTVRSRVGELVYTMELDPPMLVTVIGGLVMTIWWRVVLAMIVLGILDYGFQRWQHEQDLRMTHQEAKEEARQFEGDPKLKGRIRQIQRQMAMQRMMGEVPTADVIITNPTTYAVALRYDMAKMQAPVVVAKGARLVAERIRTVAVEHQVPIVRKPELARTLYRTVSLDHPVPEKLFVAVAEVLAYVFQIDRRVEKQQERRRHMAGTRAA